MKTAGGYDVAIIGGGPVGCVAALAFAKRGAHVLVLEANPRAATRLAGEWLHPPAVEVLAELGVDLGPEGYPTGRGFAVLPDDGSQPIVLSYPAGRSGASLHHELLVTKLRSSVVANGSIEYVEGARVTAVEDQRVRFRLANGIEKVVEAAELVGATGRTGVVHRALGVEARARTYSRMAGVLLKDVALPFEGYGHLCLGAPGPVLVYRVSTREVRVCFDVPLSFEADGERAAALFEAYAPALPRSLHAGFERALVSEDIAWAANQTRLRRTFGRPGFALIGDAVGHHHPLTAAGLTFGFLDAMALSKAKSFEAYRRERDRGGRVPEVLAIALYDIFAGTADETTAMRHAVFRLWRDSGAERDRTMRLLSGDVTNFARFGFPFLKVLGRATASLVEAGLRGQDARHGAAAAARLSLSAKDWISAGALHLREAPESADASAPLAVKSDDRISQSEDDAEESPARALAVGYAALVAKQDEDGSWEGESDWCPMTAAQYVLTWHIMGRSIGADRERRVLRYFERSRLPSGVWGLSSASPPSLFVTTLVYVASRVLGVPADAPLLAKARELFAAEGGVESIPTWGKFWLCLLSLYRWEGVNPVIPELWAMPLALPVHPARYYCHTRLIYLGMATLYAERFQMPATSLTLALRDELYPQGWANVDFAAARTKLRPGDLYAEPAPALKLSYGVLRAVDKIRTRGSRAALLDELRRIIRWELTVSSHTSISPVSGVLNILALWFEDPRDPDVLKAIDRFDCWIWEDDRDGLRITGARSAIWDTGFAMSTLAAAAPHIDVESALVRGSEWLATQQIKKSFPNYAENHRADPLGGYPFSFVWHGWPVSDCTAEAILGRLEVKSGPAAPSDEDVALAAGFILRSQGPDGGFGSYEAPRVRFSIERFNPAEMFGDNMTEAGYVECTASCIAALAKIAEERPHLLARPELAFIPDAIRRGAESIRRNQFPEGSWPGAWAVQMIYGTWFGVRGLLAAGAPPTDPAIRKACAWLKAQQRADGGWGERPSPDGRTYTPHDEAQVVQTAWALMTLCEARDPEFAAAERAAAFLTRSQLGSGEWPKQDPVGLFFRTALLDYELYRAYFPVWALAEFETRRKARASLSTRSRSFTRELSIGPQVSLLGAVGTDGE